MEGEGRAWWGCGDEGSEEEKRGDGLRWVNTVSGVVLVKTRSRE